MAAATMMQMRVMSVREQFPVLAGNEHYLDSGATALMPQAVMEATAEYDARWRGNVGRGVHRFAEAADCAYATARQTVAAALSVPPPEVVFTAGCTAGLNLLAAAVTASLSSADIVLLSVAEHHSNIVPWQIAAARRGFRLRFFPLDAAGAPDCVAAAAAAADCRVRVIAVTHRSNVSGATADLPAFARLAQAVGAQLVVDGAQYVPHTLPDLPATGADFYLFSGHKCYAPNGIGVLWGRHAALAALPPVVGGGGAITEVTTAGYTPADLPQRLEAGTPPITPAVGLAAAVGWMQHWQAKTAATVLRLAEKLRRGLEQIADVHLLFPDAAASPIVSFVVDGVHSHDVCEYLAMKNIAMRGGHHCAEPLMTHLGIGGCVRASLAPYNDDGDIEAAVTATAEAAAVLR